MCSRLIIVIKIWLILVHIPKEVGGNCESNSVWKVSINKFSFISPSSSKAHFPVTRFFFYSNEGYIMSKKMIQS